MSSSGNLLDLLFIVLSRSSWLHCDSGINHTKMVMIWLKMGASKHFFTYIDLLHMHIISSALLIFSVFLHLQWAVHTSFMTYMCITNTTVVVTTTKSYKHMLTSNPETASPCMLHVLPNVFLVEHLHLMRCPVATIIFLWLLINYDIMR